MVIDIKQHVPLAPHTIYQIGGPARFFVEARRSDDVKEALKIADSEDVDFFVFGAGSNMLVADNGYDGMAIRMAGGKIEVSGDRLAVDAGAMMARVVTASAKHNLTGFEWGIGVPGTIGGSVRGNAGCFGGEMKDVVEEVVAFDARQAKTVTLRNVECAFQYRHSIFKKQPHLIVLSAMLKLSLGKQEEIRSAITRMTTERIKKQDIGTKTCGCIFKNPSWDAFLGGKNNGIARYPALNQFANAPGVPASFLIDQAGLKGTAIGRASISKRHANFFMNKGGASAQDIRMLIAATKGRVCDHFGIMLEEEIQYIGF